MHVILSCIEHFWPQSYYSLTIEEIDIRTFEVCVQGYIANI